MRITLAPLVVAFGIAAPGCATNPVTGSAPRAESSAPALGGAASRVVEIGATGASAQPREVRVLVDEPALKLASIVLRGGTVLTTHHAAVPVTIVAMQGSGTVVVGDQRHRIDATHAVVLAANVAHAVEPDGEADLVLLVHHLGRAVGEEHHQ